MRHDTITVERFYTEQAQPLELDLIAGETGLKRVIREPTVNRPGLALAGFTRYFAHKRIQVIGNAESHFLRTLSEEEREKRYTTLFSYRLPVVVFSRKLKADKVFLRCAEKVEVPILVTPMITMKFINLATIALETLFAPRGTEIGSMVDILGVGVIIRGESGIGKSESVLALIERGYSLVSDDVTRVTLIDGRRSQHSPRQTRGLGREPQSLERSAGCGPLGHGAGIRQNPGGGGAAHHHSRATRT